MAIQQDTRHKVTLSVVSHGQHYLLGPLFEDLERHCRDHIEVILTHNLPEEHAFGTIEASFPVRLIHNTRPKGFAENHNAAFASGCSEYFCVINPDIRLRHNPFPALIATLKKPQIGVVAPLILDSQNTIADSARKFPTVLSILRKLGKRNNLPDYPIGDTTFFPDWVAGMFMLFHQNVFNEIRGFDKSYFLYYEDVDICARLRLAGYRAALCPAASAIHDAQRTSHRKLRYLKWHLSSMLRFFILSAFRRIGLKQKIGK